MPRKAQCCCPRHAEWGHVLPEEKEMRIATIAEKRYCGADDDGRHTNRRRKVCVYCRERIKLELELETKVSDKILS